MQIPFFTSIASSQTILIAGVGGGFDIVSGMPLYKYLLDRGKEVILANLSFTELASANCEMLCRGLYRVTPQAADLLYFPEKMIVDWLHAAGESVTMYAFSNLLGVAPLRTAYQEIIERHGVDTLILTNGGTDSLMFGDECGVGTIIEDSCSLTAAAGLPVDKRFLVATAFGIEQYHDLDHYACLQNIATITRADAFYGSLSLTREMTEGRHYLDLVDYLNRTQPHAMSIVAYSVASALRGEFGDFHATPEPKEANSLSTP